MNSVKPGTGFQHQLEPLDVASALDRHLRTETLPMAVRILRSGKAAPEKARRPAGDMGIRAGICQAMSMARRYGWTLALDSSDINCPIALVAFGFHPAHPFYTDGNLAAGMYAETCGQGALTEQEVPMLPAVQSGTIVIAPLARCDFEPDVVVLYGNSAQIVRLAAASLWKTGGAVESRSTGRADCADMVIRTLKTGKQQVILPCFGDRVFGQTQDHEMAFSFPWSMSQDIIDGLEGSHKGGVRYPIPHNLRYSPQFPPKYQELLGLLEGKQREREN